MKVEEAVKIQTERSQNLGKRSTSFTREWTRRRSSNTFMAFVEVYQVEDGKLWNSRRK